MNCLLEAVAGAYLSARKRIVSEPPEDEVYGAHDGLEHCRRNMLSREEALTKELTKMGEEALRRKKEGNVLGARSKLMERHRIQKRLEKLRSGMNVVDAQIDAIRSSELDKEIMLSLKASTEAMKKAGIGSAFLDAGKVMDDLDDNLREIQDVTSVLANPMAMGIQPDEAELDDELQWLEQEGPDQIKAPPASAVALTSLGEIDVHLKPASLSAPDRVDAMPESG
jgi:Snf7